MRTLTNFNLPPCTCHLVLLGRANVCQRELLKARPSCVLADDPTTLNEIKEGRRNSIEGMMQPPSDQPGEVENETFNDQQILCEPVRKRTKEQRKVQRKWSKTTTLRNAARSKTVGTREDDGPRAPWDKFLKHFDRIQLEFIYEQFEVADVESRGDIKVDDALEILAGWCAANYDLTTFQPGADALQDVLSHLGNGDPIDRLNFDLLVKFLRLCEAKMLQADPKAGFKHDDMEFLQQIFDNHSKSRVRRNADGSNSDEIRCSLSTIDVFAVLQDMGRDTSEVKQQMPIRDLIKQMDVDCSGDLDLAEFLQFARTVRMMDAEEERELERQLVCNSEFSYSETEELLLLFQKYDELEAGVFQQHQFVDLIESNGGGKLSQQAKLDLIRQVQEFGGLEDEDEEVSFGQFLGIMHNLIDQDVCGLRTWINHLDMQMQEEKRFLAPEVYQNKYKQYFDISKTSWLISNLIDKKKVTLVDKNEAYFLIKRGTKERMNHAMMGAVMGA